MKQPDTRTVHGSNVIILGRRPVQRVSYEFMPAALEILETPASPLGRAVAATIALFFVAAFTWAYFGHVDVIASATGKIIPTGRSKIIQPLEPGIVSAIHVADGDRVSAGQLLVVLDPTITEADHKKSLQDLMTARLDVARLSALRDEIDTHQAPLFEAPPGASPAAVTHSKATMFAQSTEQKAKIASLEQQIAQKEAEARQAAETIAKHEALIPLLTDETDVRKKAMEIQFGNKIAYLDAQEKLVDEQHELVVQRQHAVEIEAAKSALERQREQTQAEYTRNILSDLSDAQRKADDLSQDVAKSSEKLEERSLRAPVDGTVQQLAVHTIGGVVTPAQQLMTIVPQDSKLVVEAMVSNQDIGFVKPGQDAEIKIDTFNFTRYGLLHGKVLSVSQDAITQDAQADKSKSSDVAGSPTDSSEPKGQQLVYSARISLDDTRMLVDGHYVSLGPGMAVTAEVKTDSRRVIEYLLSPLLRYKQDSLRER
jgi:hemolysin D